VKDVENDLREPKKGEMNIKGKIMEKAGQGSGKN
jgi:hypothetical protein